MWFNTENKIKILSLLVAILVIFNLAIIGTIIYRTKSDKKEVDVDVNISADLDSAPMSSTRFGQFLNLSSEQMDEFRVINRNFRHTAIHINQELERKRIQIFNELQKENPDTLNCKKLSNDIGDLHRDLKVMTYQFYINLKNICTPNQQARLQEVFKPAFHTPKNFGHSRGGGGRYRRGFLLNNRR